MLYLLLNGFVFCALFNMLLHFWEGERQVTGLGGATLSILAFLVPCKSPEALNCL